MSSLFLNFKILSLYDIIISKMYAIFFKAFAFTVAAAHSNKTNIDKRVFGKAFSLSKK